MLNPSTVSGVGKPAQSVMVGYKSMFAMRLESRRGSKQPGAYTMNGTLAQASYGQFFVAPKRCGGEPVLENDAVFHQFGFHEGHVINGVMWLVIRHNKDDVRAGIVFSFLRSGFDFNVKAGRRMVDDGRGQGVWRGEFFSGASGKQK